MSHLNVVQLPVGNLQDVPGMLRRIADMIERGEEPNPHHAVMVTCDKDGHTHAYCFGDVPNVVTAVGVLQYGILHLTIEA